MPMPISVDRYPFRFRKLQYAEPWYLSLKQLGLLVFVRRTTEIEMNAAVR